MKMHLARARLNYGELLRRENRRTDAREFTKLAISSRKELDEALATRERQTAPV
jgi:hypothetical protein